MRFTRLTAFDFETRREAAAFALLLLFVVVAPVFDAMADSSRSAIGGGAPGPRGAFLIAFSAFAIAAITFLSGAELHRLRRLTVPLGAILSLGILGVLQLLPMPEAVLAQIAPVNGKIYHETAQILVLFGREAPASPRISIAPVATLQVSFLAFGYAALFLSATVLLRNRYRRRLFAAVILASALGQMVFGFYREGGHGRLHGTFVNPNHLGGYLGILLALAFGVLWAEVLTGQDRTSAEGRGEKIEKRFLPLTIRVLVWGVLAVGISLTGSRGAILAAGVTTVALFALAMIHRRAKSRKWAGRGLAIAVGTGILFVALIAGARPFRRLLMDDVRSDLRTSLWKTSVEAWRQFPLVGAGLGAFPEAFRRVQPREMPFLVEQAHNEFLQLLVTGGSLGAALGVVLFASLFVVLFRAWRRQKHREESAFVLAGIGALLSVTLHGLVEFNLSIPVIPATLACVLGAAWAAAPDR